ncbi:translation initiation factor IF-2 [Candidatus Falkowbacteria bacterium RIFOXYB2_FULL_34_18]|uniref:Translation initiation factor IF-2 n=1 Tax=Candidatus Falkowbacteria bacterium RIFOXYD2_FULL_34_120 TaxID=1798007 RepID=A0A1F5TRE2_9BACT|nr:MAG: translation initiation factor IF-2 [Candidatus Falkowbacteria bacterium RIFOXYB2_FULL_34_18]OGF29818.1 MAG: translation initiation factor IF-2 [Candidatus Falkowbacteria bacterium RIFOXYC12_FULL_34_55]OGF37067.1 MAG: translation initiation factor IF-2 [Candidatus Falkowbacteria bacterium RIFOXYC2_FULL_34_220]OGF39259.1 MAG: translation initiation factor IF-2 [Candidatus Falkowbacteria bacterium RIFOXYD12_FULL_34_57]OGF41364.1 MAG: translation initiation factor IF-2 [Candidatus Falkowbac
MNITELARILKITPQELRNYLPLLGFHIGRKAIKINKSEANKIIKDWPNLRRKIEMDAQEKIKEEEKKKKELITSEKVEIPEFIPVRDFSALTGAPVNLILAELMKNGIFASLNEKIDFDTAWLVGLELGFEVVRKTGKQDEENKKGESMKDIIGKEEKHKLLSRPPVIVVMGHVDHGKTRLLDSIRKSHVIEGEAGGITQHIGAYQTVRNGQVLTFIDTPGHEAFTAMRSRGAKIADVAILVVAADDGVKPQTTEAYKIIESAGIPFVIAINKIDKEGANIEKTKQDISSKLNIVPEDWGGKIVCVPISAKQGTGITDLLDMVLLTAETESENIKANPDASAAGTIIESNIDKGAGPVATILIQNGTLRVGDQLVLNNIIVGKIKSLNNYKGEKIESAGPATPTQIIGLKIMPEVGDVLQVGEGEKVKYKKNRSGSSKGKFNSSNNSSEEDETIKKINIIIKSDVLGSAEAIEESLEKINTKNVQVKVIKKGLGNITDGDIKRAEASGGQILGFNVKIPSVIEEIARDKNIKISIYSVIYDLINDIRKEMEAALDPTIQRKDLGRLKVRAIFRTEKNCQILGGIVLDDKIESDSLIEVVRNKEIIDRGKLLKLQSGKQDVNIVEANNECGIQYEGKPIIEEGDILQFYKEEKIINKL